MPELWITFAMLLVIGTLSYNFPIVLPLLVEKALDGDDAAFTLVYAAFSVGSLAGSLAVARRVEIGIRTVVAGATEDSACPCSSWRPSPTSASPWSSRSASER